MDIYEIVKKLTGKIVPVGETTEDNIRFENLKAVTDLVDILLTDINVVATGKDRVEFSISRAGKFAKEFLDKLVKELEGGNPNVRRSV